MRSKSLADRLMDAIYWTCMGCLMFGLLWLIGAFLLIAIPTLVMNIWAMITG